MLSPQQLCANSSRQDSVQWICDYAGRSELFGGRKGRGAQQMVQEAHAAQGAVEQRHMFLRAWKVPYSGENISNPSVNINARMRSQAWRRDLF